MKFKFTLLLCLVVSLFMVSCGEESKSESALEGTWEVYEFGGVVLSSTTTPDISIESKTNIEGSNMDYTLVLSEADFTTNGSYDIEVAAEVDGMVLSSTTDNYTNVSGSGTYSATDTEITVNGQFFELELQGMPVSSTSGPATASYTIVDDVLTITQVDATTTDQLGIVSTSNISFESKWRKK